MPGLPMEIDPPMSAKKRGKQKETPRQLDPSALPTTSFNTLKIHENFRNPPEQLGELYPEAHRLIEPHINSFNALFESSGADTRGLLEIAISDLSEKVIFDVKVKSLSVGRPVQPERLNKSDARIYPSEARERLFTYGGKMTAAIAWSVNDGPEHVDVRELGMLPIMIRSNRCNLRDLPPSKLVAHGEEAEEMGGYFIVSGIERLIRFLIVPRRNHVIGLNRPSFASKGEGYTSLAVQIRSARADQTSQTNTLHYLSTGNVTLRFSWRKNEYMIPVMMILKAIMGDVSDKDIFAGLAQGDFENTFMLDRIELLLRSFKSYNLFSGDQCLRFLGNRFRIVLGCPEDWDDRRVGEHLLKRIVLVHLPKNQDKFRLLLFMVRKLYSLVAGDYAPDNPDSPQHQEVLMPGFLFGMMIKEKLDDLLTNMRLQLLQDIRRTPNTVDFHNNRYLSKAFAKVSANIGGKLATFLATGNMVSPTGLDLQQAAGFTIVAEKLNFYRFLAHFRCIHRGAFFMELRTTAVRKLLPESWGFLCPVHTPDGGPCGLLNHLSHQCMLVTQHIDSSNITPFLLSLGMSDGEHSDKQSVCVQLDGRIIGWASPDLSFKLATALRICKTEGKQNIPLDLEIGYVPVSKGGQYPGLYLFTSRARMMRPVKFLPNHRTDHVGPFEQVYMDIACTPEEVRGDSGAAFSHVEYAPTHMLSVLANLTPFSDFNQSPRNMYQCQMGKQTMGTPSTALPRRTDNKLYRIQTPQTPIVRPALHDTYGFDSFPNGTNAVVAVISYTGYDMEDAMILNKSAHERGFGHGTIYKSVVYDLKDIKGAPEGACFMIGPDVRVDDERREKVDVDGLPFVGCEIRAGAQFVAWYDPIAGRTKWERLKGGETAYVEEVRLIGSDHGDQPLQKVHIKLRIPRSPVIGDKFSSRHGQKGVCSQKWPAIDMPFSESGMQPDVIINPHAFPSRMTIGMFVESLAGKAGAMHGLAQDATPFCFNESDTPSEYFGNQLLAAGYNYHGNEPMYSGITGKEFAADIYIGLVYYQRLRHMVGDKWQVRTEGPVDSLTHQPIKGRKRGGGVRFGEMERDALLAHGTSFLLQDRLMNCSDWSTAWVCRQCGSMISLGFDEISLGSQVRRGKDGREIDSAADSGPAGQYCRICRATDRERERIKDEKKAKSSQVQVPVLADNVVNSMRSGRMDLVVIPFVFRYLLAELAAMGIDLKLEVK